MVPAASGPHQLVVNGMSPSNRGTKWSNSGMVVETRPEDLLLPEMQLQADPISGSQEALTEELILRDGKLPDGTVHTLAMMRFQEKLEQICWQQGNMRQTAPSQRMVDFTRKKLSYDLPATSYSPGLVSSPPAFLDAAVPERTPQQGVPTFWEKLPRLSNQRSRHDCGRNPHFLSCTHRT